MSFKNLENTKLTGTVGTELKYSNDAKESLFDV